VLARHALYNLSHAPNPPSLPFLGGDTSLKLFFVFWIEARTQDFALAKQALNCLSHTSSPPLFFFGSAGV
jgi:hypothetical protein